MSSLAGGWTSNFNNTMPWGDSLASSMQSQAQFDPTDPTSVAPQPSSASQKTSPVRMLNTQTQPPQAQQGGTFAQAATAAPAGSWASFQSLNASPTAVMQSKVANPAAVTLAGSTGTARQPVGVNAQGPIDYSGYGNQYAGDQLVSVRTQAGNYAYYQFNPKTGQYTLAGVYTKDGKPAMQGTTTLSGPTNPLQQTGIPGVTAGMGGGSDGMPGMGAPIFGTNAQGQQTVTQNGSTITYTPYAQGTLTADQLASAHNIGLGGGQQISDAQAGSAASLGSINNAYTTDIGAYKDNYGSQATAQASAIAQAQQSNDTQAILDWMITHNGTPPTNADLGFSGAPRYSDAAYAAAAQEYANNNSASYLQNLQMDAPDTKAVDQNALANLLSLNSQYQSGAGGADAAAYGSTGGVNSVSQGGKNQLAHDADYADKFNINVNAFNATMQQQAAADSKASSVKLQQDIMVMSDKLQALEQQAGQLDAQSRQAVQASIQALRNKISDYQAAANQLAANNQRVGQIASGVLGAGAAIATAGIASPAAAAAAAAAGKVA